MHIALIAPDAKTYAALKNVRVIQPPGTQPPLLVHLHVLLDNPKRPLTDETWRLIQAIKDVFRDDLAPNSLVNPPEQVSLGYEP